MPKRFTDAYFHTGYKAVVLHWEGERLMALDGTAGVPDWKAYRGPRLLKERPRKTCPTCNGKGKLHVVDCPRCNGTGFVD